MAKTYEDYLREAKEVRLRQKTAFMTQPNEAEPIDPRKWGEVGEDDVAAFGEALRCVVI